MRVCFLLIAFGELFIYSRFKSFIRYMIFKYFHPVSSWSFDSLSGGLLRAKDFNFNEVHFINFFPLSIMVLLLYLENAVSTGLVGTGTREKQAHP